MVKKDEDTSNDIPVETTDQGVKTKSSKSNTNQQHTGKDLMLVPIKDDGIPSTKEDKERAVCNFKIENLKCLKEVDSLLKQGLPLLSIARFIQNERNEYTTVKLKSVEKALLRYVKNAPVAEFVSERLPSIYWGMVDSIDRQIDELDALSNIFCLQFDRVMMDYTNEKTINSSLSTNTTNIDLLRKIATDIGNLKSKILGNRHGIDSSSGAEKAKIRSFEEIKMIHERIEEKHGAKVAAMISDPARRRKVLGMYDKLKKGTTPEFMKIIEKLEKKYLTHEGAGHSGVIDVTPHDKKEDNNG